MSKLDKFFVKPKKALTKESKEKNQIIEYFQNNIFQV